MKKIIIKTQLVSSLLVLTSLTPQLHAQEGNFSVEIKQPALDTLYTCPGKSTIYMAEGQNEDGTAFDPNQVVFTWDVGFETNSVSGKTVTYAYPEGGHYILRLYVTNLNGDPAQNVPSLHVFVAMAPDFTGTRSDRSSFCSGESITLTGFVSPKLWDADDSPFINTFLPSDFVWSGSNMVSDRHGVGRTEPPLDEGHLDYIFRVQDDFGCFHDTSLTLYGVYAEYTMDPLTGEAPLDVTFSIDSSSNGGNETSIEYNWEFYERSGDPTILLYSSEMTFSFERPGEYVTRMRAKYDQCTYSYASEQLVQVDSSLLEIPNVFTPNEDGANDYFQVKSLSLRHFYGKIFNRWGKLVYEWDDWKALESGWNGKNQGTGADSPSGTYYYIIEATGWDDKPYIGGIYKGFLTLIR
ncbi:MAG: T9SS type B sorting domain-containing protein [Bacteroidetes bacterium]|jgi:gliding motility-associated-like protein|nr:T9SS type B sorting domain-containing protein [Bacteroidota bacterium]MBT3747450.1 T9SS type B sorting domain-containing protein [Bacteroidota bacterium]MBT4400175.1 T9SS type B sorting domain-containing protein [Bacteroidota bacterium]MBT4410075.1 T9SS type B sorting domain-containing protein [Bacteroidota bacterium]MBT5425626.1 T9SS type B sorting domain-containing protein [Bacteroidota bacterium]